MFTPLLLIDNDMKSACCRHKSADSTLSDVDVSKYECVTVYWYHCADIKCRQIQTFLRLCADMLTNLSVCKDGCIVTLKTALDEPLCAVGVDGFLLGVHVEDIVIGEGLILTQDHLRLSRHHICTDVTALNLFFGQLRTDPDRQKKIFLKQPIKNRCIFIAIKLTTG